MRGGGQHDAAEQLTPCTVGSETNGIDQRRRAYERRRKRNQKQRGLMGADEQQESQEGEHQRQQQLRLRGDDRNETQRRNRRRLDRRVGIDQILRPIHADRTEREGESGRKKHHDRQHRDIRVIIKSHGQRQREPRQRDHAAHRIRAGEDAGQRPEGKHRERGCKEEHQSDSSGNMSTSEHRRQRKHQQPWRVRRTDARA